MIEGRYEIRLHLDNNGKAFQKEIVMGQLIENAEDFMRKLMEDLRVVAPVLDRYWTVPDVEGEKEDAEL